MDKKELLRHAVSRVLRPLVRLIMMNGLGYREFCDLARMTYFEVGNEILHHQNHKLNNSRLALLTGLNRKEISRLDAIYSEQGENVSVYDKPRSAGAAVIAAWVSDPRYLNASDEPLELPYASDSSDVPSFTSLVEGVSKDMRAKAYLAELQRLELIEVTNDAVPMVKLRRDAFVPTTDYSEKLAFFAGNIHDHMAAAMSNIEGVNPPFFERSAFHGDLSESDIVALQKMINAKGMTFLKNIYREAEILSKTKSETNIKDKRMTLGVYFYAEDDNKNEK